MMMKKLLLALTLGIVLAVQALTARYPDASVLLLKDRETVTYQADGTAETVEESSYRVMTYAGLLKMRTLDMAFNADFGTLEVVSLRLDKADGRSVTLNPAELVRIGIDAGQMSSRIYDPAHKKLSLRIPGLEVGDTISLVTRRRLFKPRIPGEWSDICVMQADFPIVDCEYVVDAPASKPLLSIAVKDGIADKIGFSEEKQSDRIIYRWTARDVPQAFPEPAMPPLYTCCQRVLVSTVKDWRDISRWYARLCAPRLAKVNDAMKRKCAELTAGKPGAAEKIDALFRFVSQQVRYTGITDEENAPGYEPHDVEKTFDRLHGVCRDKAALLTAMLRLAGIEAYPVLFMAGDPKDAEVPNIYFNHAIVAAVVDGKYILMDPTSETAGELFPAYLAGNSYLVARPEGETLRTAPPVAAEKNLLCVIVNAESEATGRMYGTVKLKFTGWYDNAFRGAFAEWSDADIRNFFTARLRGRLPGADIRKVTVRPTPIMDMSRPLEVTLDFVSEPPVGTVSGVRTPPLPRLTRTLGLFGSLYRAAAPVERRFPMRAMPRAVREKITVRLSGSEEVAALPDPVAVAIPEVFRFDSRWRTGSGTLEGESFFAVDSMRVSPADCKKLRDALAAADTAAENVPLLRPTLAAADADSLVLEHTEAVEVLSAHDWNVTATVRRKILNHAGVAAHAELRVPYLDGVDAVEIRGEVVAPDGTRHTLSARELNRMDAPGAAAMPRYPRRKYAVASFPGVKVGSEIVYTVTKKLRGRAVFRHQFLFQNYTPARKREVRFTSALPLRWEFSGGSRVRRSDRNEEGRAVTVFTVEDVPALPRESGAPGLADFAPCVLAAMLPDYEAWNRSLTAAVVADAELETLAKRLTEGKSGLAAADALRKFVSERVRAVERSFEEQGTKQLTAPKTTLAEGYGSSADRAILLAAMLKAVGIRWRFVFVAARPWHGGGLPRAPWSKVLVALPDHPGYGLNDIPLHGVLGASSSAGCPMLDAPGSPAKVVVPARLDGIALRCELEVAPDLSAVAALNWEYRGSEFGVEAERFARFTPETKRRHFEDLAAAVAPDAEVLAADADFSAYPGRVTMKVRLPGYARRAGTFVRCPLPGADLIRWTASVPTAQRRLPYRLHAAERSCEYTVKFPDKWQLRRESGTAAEGFSETLKLDRGQAVIRQKFSAPERILSPAEYAKYLETDRHVNSPDAGRLLFRTE